MSSNKTNLAGALVAEAGEACIRYRGPDGHWTMGTRIVDASGVVTYADDEAALMPEPAEYAYCDVSCTRPEQFQFCGPLELMGMGDLISALAASGTPPVLSCGSDGFIAVNGVPSTVPCGAPALEYTFPATVGADGVLVVTDSSGGTQTVTIEHPEDKDAVRNEVVDGVVYYYDADDNLIDGLELDLNTFISSPHPTISATGDATATFDAVANEWTIGFVDTDTDTFAKLNGNIVTFANGDTLDVTPAVDTNVSAVALEWDTDRLRSTVTEDGVDVVGELVIPAGARECGDKALMVDPVTGVLELKEMKPQRQETAAPFGLSAATVVSDYTDTSVALWTYHYGSEVCATVTNTSSCRSATVHLDVALIAKQFSTFSEYNRTTIHQAEYSVNGSAFAPFISNLLLNHAHFNTAQVNQQKGQTASISIDLLITTLAAGESVDLCVRIGHLLRPDYSNASIHTVNTQMTGGVYLREDYS